MLSESHHRHNYSENFTQNVNENDDYVECENDIYGNRIINQKKENNPIINLTTESFIDSDSKSLPKNFIVVSENYEKKRETINNFQIFDISSVRKLK